MALKKSDLYSSLWASCDELRGGMDASQYKDYVLFMLFIKYVSDKYGDSDDFAPPVTIPKGASFKDMVALKGGSDIGNKINTQVIQPLIDANSRLARSDFPDFNDPNKLGEGSAKVERLSHLIAIFEKPELDFSKNRAEHDDILGDAYEYLMRHFATESGKSKGQFYTPSEVSRVIAKVIGISPTNSVAATTAYDPTCGSGSLLLKIAAEAGTHITLEGQEKDVTTAGLARMNMILHDFPAANILSGNTLFDPKFKNGEQLRTYDYVVANPPFSDKTWSTGLTPAQDRFQRFTWGVPPKKKGDYAYLLHIIRSMKGTGKAACILPHGVLFRGNVEAVIRKQLVRSGYLKAIIGLPANLFYGTGIPACILVLDKANATVRKGIFMIDASKHFMKDGPKNRLREQDIHRIVDTFAREDESDPRFARMVPVEEIAELKNDYNLNLPRYIDSTEPEDLQDIDGHLRGGIPERDVDDPVRLRPYWGVLPSVRSGLFKNADRSGYCQLRLPIAEVKPCIFGHPEFIAFHDSATRLFVRWKETATPLLNGLAKEGQPKLLIEVLAEDLLTTFATAPLLNAYDVYQHLMDYWAETMQDDCYLVVADGWKGGAQPREIRQVRNKENKLVWPEPHDFKKGKRRFKSDLIPASILIDRYFVTERDGIAAVETELSAIDQQLDEKREEQSGEDGLLTEVIEGEGEKQKITVKAIKARLKEIGQDADYSDERLALEDYSRLLDNQAEAKTRLRAAQEDLDAKLDAKYPKLSEDEIKILVVEDKWLATVAAAVQGELDRVSQTLTGRIRQLAERYATPLPQLTEEVAKLAKRVDEHLEKIGAVKQAAVQQLLTGQTRLPGFHGDWEVTSLAATCTMKSGEGITSANIDQFSQYPCYGGNGLRGYTSRFTHDGSFALIGRQGALCGNVFGVEGKFFASEHAIVVTALPQTDIRWLTYVLRRMNLNQYSESSAQPGLSVSKILILPLAVPPTKAEQAAIADVLTDMDAELAALEQRLAKTRDIKQAMMQELLTGKTRLVSAEVPHA
jgi:type I restriction enzyme M protein